MTRPDSDPAVFSTADPAGHPAPCPSLPPGPPTPGQEPREDASPGQDRATSPEATTTTQAPDGASSPLTPCRCEHVDHFDQLRPSCHPYGAENGQVVEAREVGQVCLPCARTHVPEFIDDDLAAQLGGGQAEVRLSAPAFLRAAVRRRAIATAQRIADPAIRRAMAAGLADAAAELGAAAVGPLDACGPAVDTVEGDRVPAPFPPRIAPHLAELVDEAAGVLHPNAWTEGARTAALAIVDSWRQAVEAWGVEFSDLELGQLVSELVMAVSTAQLTGELTGADARSQVGPLPGRPGVAPPGQESPNTGAEAMARTDDA